YTVAYLVAGRTLDIAGRTLPRGRLLVMGGNLVFPVASTWQYRERCIGPYRAALPAPSWGEPPPSLYALPGSRDWSDGLTAFLRTFARSGGAVGGWRTRQSRSYFVVRLTHGWWLFVF